MTVKKEIRLFLCLKDPLDGERISVLRSVEDAKTEWMDAHAKNPRATALLHAGSDRPSFETLRPLLEAHKGYLFLSEAVRWLLDSSHTDTRVAGRALDEIPGQRAQPVYLATRGWGYDDSFAGPESVQNELNGNGRLMASDRYLQLVKSIDVADPFEVARICPQALVDVELSGIPMPVRCQNVLTHAAIRTIKELRSIYLRDAFQWANFGKKSAVDLATALQRFIEARMKSGLLPPDPLDPDGSTEGDERAGGIGPDDLHGTLLDDINEFIASLKETQQIVLRERIFNGKKLEYVGELVELTRERVRQIESKLLESIHKGDWAKLLTPRLERLLSNRTEPLYLDLIEVEDPWFAGWSMRANELSNLIRVFPSELSILRSQERLIVSRISSDRFDRVLRSTMAFLAQQLDQQWTRADVELFVEGAVRSEKAPELAGFAMDILQPELHFARSSDNEQEVLCSAGSRVNDHIMAILRSAESPLHYLQIASAVSERTGKMFPIHNIHARLQRTPALFFGRGRFGVEAHYPLSTESDFEVAALAEQIMRADPHRQWHAAELIEALEDQCGDLPEALDRYVLSILLSRSLEFQSMGRMVWALKADGGMDSRGRIDLSNACVQVLVEAGRALHNREIKDRIGRLRGTSEYFFMQPTERLIRIAPNKWGLIERDLGLSPLERALCLSELETRLTAKDVALHVSELRDAVGHSVEAAKDLTGYMLMGLAQSDLRFRIHRGHLVALSSWNDPRRLTVRAAISICVDSGQTEVGVNELIGKVSAMVGRPVNRGDVTNMLLNIGWRRLGASEVYVTVGAEDDDELLEESLETEVSPPRYQLDPDGP